MPIINLKYTSTRLELTETRLAHACKKERRLVLLRKTPLRLQELVTRVQKMGELEVFSVIAVAVTFVLEHWVEADLHMFYPFVIHCPPVAVEWYVKDPRIREGNKVSTIP